jgi:hypothetical protein
MRFWQRPLAWVSRDSSGWRKQVALAFAGFLLVKRHCAPLTHMILLWSAIQAAGWLASPRVGRLIDRVGEKPVLTFYYASMTLVFLGGLLWNSLGYRWAFLIGIPAAATSILIVLRLPSGSPSGDLR